MIYKDLEEKYGSGVYYKRDLEIVRGKGVYLYDSQNNEYIDCVGGHGVCLFGHSHPKIIKAIKDQSDRLISCPEIFYNDKRAELLEKLAEITQRAHENFSFQFWYRSCGGSIKVFKKNNWKDRYYFVYFRISWKNHGGSFCNMES